jgi:putative tributyrin esterase
MAWLSINYESTVLHMPVMLDVLMPQGHGNYKTLYLLHGAGGDHLAWLLKSRVADYVEGKNIAVVMPSGNNRCYVNNRYGKDYATFITNELITFCETCFSLSTKKEDRYIGGMSMGGYGAFYSSLLNPDIYTAAFSYSGLLDIKQRYEKPQGLDMFPVFGSPEEFEAGDYDLFKLIHKQSALFHENVDNATRFVVMCGEQDPRLSMSLDIYKILKLEGILAKLYKEPGKHHWDYWNLCIHRTIEMIEQDSQRNENWRSLWQ